MNKTTSLMIDLIRASLEQKHGKSIGELDSNELSLAFELAGSHDVAHLIAYGVNKLGVKVEDKLLGRLARSMMLAVYRYERQAYELERACRVLEESGVCFILLKGSVLLREYPEPWMRTMSDIDVLVKRENVDKARKLLCEGLGYTQASATAHDFSLISESGVNVELHFSLTDEETEMAIGQRVGNIMSDVWSYAALAEGSTARYELSDEFFYFYHVAHAAKHLINGGCGVKPFIDTYILDGMENADRKARRELLERAGLLELSERMSKLARVWLGGEQYDDVSREFENYVIMGGVYGSVSNKVAVHQVKHKGKLGYAVSRVFLPYDIIKYYYPVLQKHKWLTPIFEVVRWFSVIFRGGAAKSVAEMRINDTVSSEQRSRAADLLKNIGL